MRVDTKGLIPTSTAIAITAKGNTKVNTNQRDQSITLQTTIPSETIITQESINMEQQQEPKTQQLVQALEMTA